MHTWILLTMFLQGVADPPPPPPPPPPLPTVARSRLYGFCAPSEGNEARAVERLQGDYRIVGLSPKAREPYSGTMKVVASTATEIRLEARIGTKTRNATARYVRCGEGVKQLFVTVDRPGVPQQLYCVVHHDYDNLHRATCSGQASDGDGDNGLEAWFEIIP